MQRRARLSGLGLRKRYARADGKARGRHRVVQRREQRRPVHGEPVTPAGKRIIAHVKHGAAAEGIRAVQPVDAVAERMDFGRKAERVEHGKPGRLHEKTRTDRRRFFEALDQLDPVAGARQKQRGRKPGRPRAGNAYMQWLHARPRPGPQSAAAS